MRCLFIKQFYCLLTSPRSMCSLICCIVRENFKRSSTSFIHPPITSLAGPSIVQPTLYAPSRSLLHDTIIPLLTSSAVYVSFPVSLRDLLHSHLPFQQLQQPYVQGVLLRNLHLQVFSKLLVHHSGSPRIYR